MHAGKLHTEVYTGDPLTNAVTRVYQALKRHLGTWVSVDDLSKWSHTVSTSTRISELNPQLPDRYQIEHIWTDPYAEDGQKAKRGSWYRMVRAK